MATNLIELTRLKRDTEQDDLYDLFIQSFAKLEVGLLITVITRKYEMRLDLLCVDLYGSAEYIGMIMKINDIFNPFSVKIGDVIGYIPSENLTDSLFIDPKLQEEQRQKLVNALKATRGDANRRTFLDNIGVPPALPPTVSTDGTSKSVIENGKIVIAPDLFTNPNTDIGTSEPLTDTGLGDITSGATDPGIGQNTGDVTTVVIRDGGVSRGDGDDDDTERVLVQRFVRSGSNIIESETFEDDDDTNTTTN